MSVNAPTTQPPATTGTAPATAAPDAKPAPAQPDYAAQLKERDDKIASLTAQNTEAMKMLKEHGSTVETLKKQMSDPKFIVDAFTKAVGADKPVDPVAALKAKDEENAGLRKSVVKMAQERAVLDRILSEPDVEAPKVMKAVKMFRVEHSDALELGDDFAPKDKQAFDNAFGNFKTTWPDYFKKPAAPAPTTAAPANTGQPFNRTPAPPNQPDPTPPGGPPPQTPSPQQGPWFGWGSKAPALPTDGRH